MNLPAKVLASPGESLVFTKVSEMSLAIDSRRPSFGASIIESGCSVGL
jgi:hypothetical protein